MTAGSHATDTMMTTTMTTTATASISGAALHAVWAMGSLWLWGEGVGVGVDATQPGADASGDSLEDATPHPYALDDDTLRSLLAARLALHDEKSDTGEWPGQMLRLRLPTESADNAEGSAGPMPSPTLDLVRRLTSGVGQDAHVGGGEAGESSANAGTLFGLDGADALGAELGDFGLDAEDLDDLSLDEAAFTAQSDTLESDGPGAIVAEGDAAAEASSPRIRLRVFSVPAISIPADAAPDILAALVNEPEADAWNDQRSEDRATRGSREHAGSSMVPGDSVRFFAVCDRFARYLVAQQRVAPMVSQDGSGQLSGQWLPWLSDADASERVRHMVASVPGSARAADDEAVRDPWTVVEQSLDLLVEAHCRAALERETMDDTVEGRDASDLHVAWLRGLLGFRRDVPTSPSASTELASGVRTWVGALEDRGDTTGWRLLLRVNEPLTKPKDGVDPEWSLSFHLQSTEDDLFIVDAVDVWLLTRDTVVLEGKRLERPQELLLAELGRASRVYTRLERALGQHEPIEMMLSTKEAYEFLREVRPLLEEQGMTVQTPIWWDTPSARLGARLRIEGAGEDPFAEGAGAGVGASSSQLGLEMLVRYQWEIAVGDTTISLHQFEQLAESQTPLVQIGGRWVEVRPEDLKAAVEFIGENPGGEMKIGEAVRLAFGTDAKESGVRITGLEAEGWLARSLPASTRCRTTSCH